MFSFLPRFILITSFLLCLSRRSSRLSHEISIFASFRLCIQLFPWRSQLYNARFAFARKFEFQIANLQSPRWLSAQLLPCDKKEGKRLFQIDSNWLLNWPEPERRESLEENTKVLFIRKKRFFVVVSFPTFICRAKSEILNCAIAHQLANSLSMSALTSKLHTVPTYEELYKFRVFSIRSSWKFTRLWLRAARREMIAIWWNLLFTSLSEKRCDKSFLNDKSLLAENKNDFFRFVFCTQSTWERDSNETMIDTACETVVWYERIVFVVREKKTHFVSYLITYTVTAHMYSGSDFRRCTRTDRDRGSSLSWRIFLHVSQSLIAYREWRTPSTDCASAHMCTPDSEPTQALANGKYVVSCRSSSSSPTLLAKQCFLLSCGRRCDDCHALEKLNLYCCGCSHKKLTASFEDSAWASLDA